MTKRRREPAITGWWIDETTPDLSDLLPTPINSQSFAAWLAPVLGTYRNAMQLRGAFPPLAQERTEIRRMARLVADTQVALRILPLRTKALVLQYCFKRQESIGLNWFELAQRIDTDLTIANLALSAADRGLSKSVPKRGRKVASPRDELLDAVIRELRGLQIKATGARDIAAKILERCLVGVPDDERAIRRAARRGQKGKV